MKHDVRTVGKPVRAVIEAKSTARVAGTVVALLLVVVVLVACGSGTPQRTLATTPDDPATPPSAKRIPHPVTQHGITRQDDYHWLREKNGNALHYLKQENAYTRHVMAPTETLQQQLYQEIKARVVETDVDVPVFDRDYYYYSRTIEGAQYPLYCRKRGSLDAPEEVLLDLNAMAVAQSFIAVGAFEISDDGHLLAYSIDNNGFRAYTLHVKDLRSGEELLGDGIPNVSSIAWAAQRLQRHPGSRDKPMLFYTVDDGAKRPYRVYRHVLGETEDALVYEERDERFVVEISRSRSRALLFVGSYSHTSSEVAFLRADDPTAALTQIKPRADNVEYYVDHRDELLYLRVNDTGRNFRIVTAPLSTPAQWTELQGHADEVMIEDLEVFAYHQIVMERVNGLPRLRVVVDASSTTIPVDEAVYELWPGDNPDFKTRFYRYEHTALASPRAVIDFDIALQTRTTRKQIEVRGDFDPNRYVSSRIFARAKDGTQIPISLIHKRDVPRDGSAPMWLTGYGAYGYPYPISFSHARLSLLDRGVIYAIAHVRGGGELGKRWHDQGRMQHKPNTFTDFIAAAEHLIAERYTSTPKLVIEGGSAGGLLMGAVTNLRPDLFGAVIADVPFVDVLNTMSDASLPLTVGEYEEWGNPNLADQYAWIAAYCPYTNITAQAYPPMLVRTAWHDSQVMYWEAAKYVAKLRVYKTDDNPLLLETSLGGGHGGASGRYDQWREVAFDYAFALWRMGLAQ